MTLLLCGLMAVVGHMFPIYLGFKGGKGVATGLGVFLFLSPVAIAISFVVFVATVGLSGIEVPVDGGLVAKRHQYALLADHVRHHVNVDRIGELAGINASGLVIA